MSKSSTEGLLRELIGQLTDLEPAQLPDTESLVHLGVGSLDMMRLSTRLRRSGVPVNFDILITEPTLRAWVAHVDAVRVSTEQP